MHDGKDKHILNDASVGAPTLGTLLAMVILPSHSLTNACHTWVTNGYGKKLACEQALSCGVGGWREEERELAIMSHKFEFRPQYPPQPLRSLAVKI